MLNIQRILYPTDLSQGADRAFPQAAALAQWHDAELHILNVAGRHDHRFEEMRENFPLSSERLDEMLGAAPAETSRPDVRALTIIQEQIESADPAGRIVTYSEEADIDVVVMGTHGRSGVERLLIGSVAEEVVRTAPCPVFTIRTEPEDVPAKAVRRILVPVDFSDASEVAVQHAKELALTYGAQIDLLHVVEDIVYPSTYGIEPVSIPTDEVIQRVEKGLADMAREELGYEHIVVEATPGYAPTSILDYVEDNDVDLVVISTHGRTGLDRVLIGSVSERVVRQAPVPVFVVKPQGRSLLDSSESEADVHPA